MALEASMNRGRIQQDIDTILKYNNPFKNNVQYEITIHTSVSTLGLQFVESVEYLRNYNKYISDFIVLKFKMYLGTYAKAIYPLRDNLMCSIQKKYIDKAASSESIMYKMVILKDGGTMESDQNIKKMTMEELNKSGMVTIEAQLYLREVEGFRNTYVDGIYKNVTIKDMLIGLLAQAKNSISIEGTPFDFNIDVVEPNNGYVYENLVIPTGVTLDNLPNYIQGVDYGIYNGGVGMYLQHYNGKICVFVYPLYSTDRFEKETGEKITFINANTSLYDTVENNWYIDGNNIKILCTSQTKIIDIGNNDLINVGDGVISFSPSELFEQNYEITDDGIIVDKDNTLEGIKIVNRRDKISKTRYIGPQSNMYKFRSDILNKSLATYQITWHFSNPDVIYCGMPCEYVYEDVNYGIVKLNGTIQAVYSRYDKPKGTQSSVVIIKVMSFNVWANQTDNT